VGRNLLVGLVSLVWALTAVNGVLTGDYLALQLVTPIMGIAAGAYLGIKVVKEVNGAIERKNGGSK
jgi:hypothetical protein